MDKDLLNKSLEELENDFWKDDKFPSTLIEKSFYARKKKLKDLSPDDLRLLITQSIGLKYTLPLSLELLQKDILVDTFFYKGDLLESVLKVPSSFWNENNNFILREQFNKTLEGKELDIRNASNITDEIKQDILNAYINFKQMFS